MGKLEEETGHIQSHTLSWLLESLSAEDTWSQPPLAINQGHTWIREISDSPVLHVAGWISFFFFGGGAVLATLLGCKAKPHS